MVGSVLLRRKAWQRKKRMALTSWLFRPITMDAFGSRSGMQGGLSCMLGQGLQGSNLSLNDLWYAPGGYGAERNAGRR